MLPAGERTLLSKTVGFSACRKKQASAPANMATLIRRKKHCGTRLRDSAPHPTGKRLKESRNPVGTTAIGVSGPQVGAKTGRPATAVLPMFEWPRCLPHLHFFDNLSPLGLPVKEVRRMKLQCV